MTVKELKEILSQFPDETKVLFFDLERGYLENLAIDDDETPTSQLTHIAFILTQQESEWHTWLE